MPIAPEWTKPAVMYLTQSCLGEAFKLEREVNKCYD
jgi:hypothetical protein